MSTNNPYDERDICTGVANDSIHQLNKLDESLGNRKRRRIYPLTYIQAVFDAKSGTRLDAILDMVNSIYLPWKGTARATRIQVPFKVRRKGLMISYRNIDNEIITEKCITDECVKDDIFGLDSSWVLITDALPISGNVTIGSNGNWFVDGEDTGFKAQGPKGENGVPLQPRLSEDKTKIEYSLDGEVWQELFPLDLVTPTIEFSEPVGLEPGSTPTVTNIGDDYNVNLQLGLPKAPSVSVGSTTTIGEGNQAKVTNSGTPYAPVLNFHIPKGDTGRGITIKGFYPDLSTLQEKVTSPEIGDVYCVGSAEPYEGYVWTNVYSSESQSSSPAWQSLGEINKDTTIIVNDLGDREDVAMSQKGITTLNTNIIDIYTIDGKGINKNTGKEEASETLSCCDFIDVDFLIGKYIYFSASTNLGLVWYDIDKKYISCYQGEERELLVLKELVPENAKYFRANKNKENSQIKYGVSNVGDLYNIISIKDYNNNINYIHYFDIFIYKNSGINKDNGKYYNLTDGHHMCSDYIIVDHDKDIFHCGLSGGNFASINFYDKEKNFISSYDDSYKYGYNYPRVLKKENIPSNAYYVRMNAYMGSEGDYSPYYAPYNTSNILFDLKLLKETSENYNEYFNSLLTPITNIPIDTDIDNWEYGYYYSNNGVKAEEQDWSIYDQIIDSGTTYNLNIYLRRDTIGVVLLDSEKKLIEVLYVNNTESDGYFNFDFYNKNASYLGLTANINYWGNNDIINKFALKKYNENSLISKFYRLENSNNENGGNNNYNSYNISTYAKIKDNQIYKIGFLGDSTTDGVGTSGFNRAVNGHEGSEWDNTYNSGGGVIGSTDYIRTNAYPYILEQLIKHETNNNNFRIYNMGWSGKTVSWAWDNREKIFGGAYKDVNAVGIVFGINDSTEVYSSFYESVSIYKTNLKNLCNYLYEKSIKVFFVTHQPAIKYLSSSEGSNYTMEMLELIIQAQIEVAKELNILVLDMNYFDRNVIKYSNYNFNDIANDILHFKDLGHKFEAGYLFSELVPRTIKLSKYEHITYNDYGILKDQGTNLIVSGSPLKGFKTYIKESSGDDLCLMDFWVINDTKKTKTLECVLDEYTTQYALVFDVSLNENRVEMNNTENNILNIGVGEIYHVKVMSGIGDRNMLGINVK